MIGLNRRESFPPFFVNDVLDVFIPSRTGGNAFFKRPSPPFFRHAKTSKNQRTIADTPRIKKHIGSPRSFLNLFSCSIKYPPGLNCESQPRPRRHAVLQERLDVHLSGGNRWPDTDGDGLLVKMKLRTGAKTSFGNNIHLLCFRLDSEGSTRNDRGKWHFSCVNRPARTIFPTAF